MCSVSRHIHTVHDISKRIHTCPPEQLGQRSDPTPCYPTGYNVLKPGEVCAAVESQTMIGNSVTHLDTYTHRNVTFFMLGRYKGIRM